MNEDLNDLVKKIISEKERGVKSITTCLRRNIEHVELVLKSGISLNTLVDSLNDKKFEIKLNTMKVSLSSNKCRSSTPAASKASRWSAVD